MSSLRLIGPHRAVSSLLENRPESWEVVRFKGLFDRVERRNGDLSYEMLSLRSTGEVVARSEMGGRQEPDEASLPRYLVAEIDDLVVNPMWLIGGGIGISGRAGAVSPDYRVFRPRSDLLPRFVHYLLRSQPYLDQYLLYTRAQTTFDRRVQQPDLNNLPIPVPPLEEQHAIVAYLDRETARIDTLIEEQQRLIEMLRERRIGVIRAGVSGLLPGGVPGPADGWFGALPEGWVSTRIRYDFSVALGKMLNASKGSSVDAIEAPYLAAGSIQPETLSLDDSKTTMFAPAELTALDLRAGDVVVVEGGAGYGRSHYLRTDLPGWGFQNHVARLRPLTGRADGLFATYCLKACLASGYIEANNRTATLPSLSREVLGSIRIPLPPLDDQRWIANYLDDQTDKIDELIMETERFIELSKERRSALFTAAVTGQIDVREVA